VKYNACEALVWERLAGAIVSELHIRVRDDTPKEMSEIEIFHQTDRELSVCPPPPRYQLWPCLAVDALEFQPYSPRMTKSEYLTEYDKIVHTMQKYIDGSRQGKSELMTSAFHPDASFFGYAGDQLAVGTKFLFDWIDKNGPAPNIEPRIVSVDILDSIAVVRLEVSGWSGNLAGSGVRMSDLFTLLKTPDGWKIIQKAFHWHAAERSLAA